MDCLWGEETCIAVTDEMIGEFCNLSDPRIRGRK